MSANAQLLWDLSGHFLVTAAPVAAAALWAARRGVRELPVLLGIALAASGLCALAAFGAYYADPRIGETWCFLVLGGSVGLIGWCLWDGGIERATLLRLAVPLALWGFASGFVLFLGFLHGGTESAVSVSALRFSGQMPTDNDIPRYFAEHFAANGHQGTPLPYPGEWQMSDRPPLQVGYVLSQHALVDTTQYLRYEVLCVIVQQLWVVGMWALLCAGRLRPSTRALAIFAALVSDVAILHGFFVWPKLIAAAFLLAALALVVSERWPEYRRDPRLAALLAALLALALLAHGSSIFGVVPLAIFALVRGGLPDWRWLGVGALVGLALLGPWSAYQQYADPPGNRLLKWQLGGEMAIDSRGTLEAIEDGYSAAGFGGSFHNKRENFATMLGWPLYEQYAGPIAEHLAAGRFEDAVIAMRLVRLYGLLPFVGLLLIGPLSMLARRRLGDPDERRFALLSLAFVGIACLFWGLALFGAYDSRTTIHVGSLAVPLLAVCGCVVAMRSVFPRAAVALVGLNAVLVLALYAPALSPPPGSSYSALAAVLAVASLAGFGAVAYVSARDPAAAGLGALRRQ